jgi:hypothetical protein
MNTNWKSGIFALVALLAIAGVRLDKEGSARQTTSDTLIGCKFGDPPHPCAADFNFGYPVGDGLVITLTEDFF